MKWPYVMSNIVLGLTDIYVGAICCLFGSTPTTILGVVCCAAGLFCMGSGIYVAIKH